MKELDRREFLIKATAFLGVFLGVDVVWLFSLDCNKKDPLKVKPQGDTKELETPYTVASLQELGRQLSDWRLANGTIMVDKFPEIKRCADLLSGHLDPAQFFPFIKTPIGFSVLRDSERAGLVMQRIPDSNDSRRIVATTKDGRVLNAPILAKNTPVDIVMSQDVLNNSIKLPVLVKEVSQLIDYPDYCQAFVEYLKSTHGASFTLHNPNNIPTSKNEIFISIANNTGLENALTGESVFTAFVDNGSFLRTGAAFVNWYQDQLRLGLKPKGRLVETGFRVTDFLMQQGLIRKEDSIFVWSDNERPQITSPKFLELVNDFSLAR